MTPPTAPTPALPPALPPAAAAALQRFVVKEGLTLGGLSHDERLMALAWVWAGLSGGPLDGEGVNEAQINTLLKAQLAGPARCLGIDHVELRRWLCDGGWLQRDGYGRVYRRSTPSEPDAAAWAAQLEGLNTAAWAETWRSAREQARAERRAQWQAQGQPQGQPQGGAAA